MNGGNYHIITIANVQEGRMALEKSNQISEIPVDLQAEQKLSIGDILISMTGNVGRVCLVTNQNCLLNQRVGKIASKENICQEFLYHILSNRIFLTRMISLAQGGAQDNLSNKDIMNYSFGLPNNEEQEKIAEFLTSLDNKVELINKELEQAKLFKKSLLQQMFV